MWKRYLERFHNSDPNLKAFLFGILLLGVNNGILNATFNNYLYDMFSINASQRGVLEFPREFPGFAILFITILLSFTSIRNWAILVGTTAAIGIFGLAYLSPNYSWMIVWMLIWSLGDHLFMPVESIIGLSLSKEKEEGKRLGQLSGARNLSTILGSAIVFILIGHFHFSYSKVYLIAVISALAAAALFYRLKIDKEEKPKKFVFRKKYSLFYIMNILFGVRKQLFLTFSPWLLISVHGTKADTIALLFLIASFLGFIFRQYFGIAVDKFGERIVLSFDALILLIICLVFAFSTNIYLLYSFFIIDSLMFATRIARTTYLNKIIVHKNELAPTISLGITVDHAISMLIPMLGGWIWIKYGYKEFFLITSFLALMNFIVSMKIEQKRT